jgi:hypothetical protein
MWKHLRAELHPTLLDIEKTTLYLDISAIFSLMYPNWRYVWKHLRAAIHPALLYIEKTTFYLDSLAPFSLLYLKWRCIWKHLSAASHPAQSAWTFKRRNFLENNWRHSVSSILNYAVFGRSSELTR